MFKKIVLNLIIIILISLCVSVEASGFSDVKEASWYYNDVSELQEIGIVNGFLDGSFKPDEFITYEQFIKMTIESLSIDVIINQKNWSEPYIEKASELNFTNFDIGKYNQDITRGDMALLLANVLNYIKEDIIINYSDLYDLPGYTEKQYISSILTLYNSGIITGFPNHTFGYEQKMTRAQACAVINRLIAPNNRQKPVISSYNHVSACPFYIDDKKNYYEVINKHEIVTDFPVVEIVECLAGEDGYVVAEYKKLSDKNLILIKYFENKQYAHCDEYSMFTLYLYDGKTNYPETLWGYDSMFAKLSLKSLKKQTFGVVDKSSQVDIFYEYKVRGVLNLLFGFQKGKDVGEYVMNCYLGEQNDSISIREKNGMKTIFFTTGSHTIKNFTFSEME